MGSESFFKFQIFFPGTALNSSYCFSESSSYNVKKIGRFITTLIHSVEIMVELTPLFRISKENRK